MLPEFEEWLECAYFTGEFSYEGSGADAYLEHKRCLGGTAGNWCDNKIENIGAAPNAEFSDLENVIKLLSPNINHQTKKALANLIVLVEESEGDWYGGVLTYQIKRLNLFDLWLRLKYKVYV